MIRLISDIRFKHGSDAVKLSKCGRFVLADDLSDIADMTHIDLSNIDSLEGASFSSSFVLLFSFGGRISSTFFPRNIAHTSFADQSQMKLPRTCSANKKIVSCNSLLSFRQGLSPEA